MAGDDEGYRRREDSEGNRRSRHQCTVDYIIFLKADCSARKDAEIERFEGYQWSVSVGYKRNRKTIVLWEI
jgi:hypothetical protein